MDVINPQITESIRKLHESITNYPAFNDLITILDSHPYFNKDDAGEWHYRDLLVSPLPDPVQYEERGIVPVIVYRTADYLACEKAIDNLDITKLDYEKYCDREYELRCSLDEFWLDVNPYDISSFIEDLNKII